MPNGQRYKKNRKTQDADSDTSGNGAWSVIHYLSFCVQDIAGKDSRFKNQQEVQQKNLLRLRQGDDRQMRCYKTAIVMEDRIEQLERRIARLESLVGTKLSQEQARKYLGVSRPTMQRYRTLGLLHPRKNGSRLYYNIAELNEFCCNS